MIWLGSTLALLLLIHAFIIYLVHIKKKKKKKKQFFLKANVQTMLCIEIYLNFKQMKMHLNLRLNKMLPYRKYEHNDVEKQKMEHKAGGLSSICHFQGGCVTCIIEIRWELSVKHLIKDMVYGWQKNWLVQVVKATLSHGWVRGSCVAWGSERGWHVNASKSHFDICC